MSKNAQIESGKACSLADLFCDDNKVVIPDLQRDYCWGKDAWIEKEKRFADLVSGFVKCLFDLYLKTSGQGKQTLGVIYGYEEPKDHIQICDGQQRLTTLFLLLGYANTRAGYAFSDYLMSKDNEPRLQYAIRESTLYFLSDLTKEFFVDDITSLESILSAYRHESGQRFPKWYFSDYDLDGSIQNMLAALNSINCVAGGKSFNDWGNFAKFLLHDLQFLYYDMGTRSRGEETYIVINTTGEPLSPAENIKPIVIGRIDDARDKKKCSGEWEEREDWFWKNRGNHKTSDINVYWFLVWYWQIGLLQERAWKDKVPYELSPRELFLEPPRPVTTADEESASVDRWAKFRKPDTIHVYFKALQKLVAIVSQDDSLRTIFQSVSFGLYGDTSFDGTLSDFLNRNRGGQNIWQLNMILPALAYLVKYPNASRLPEFIARLRKNYFDLQRVRNPLMQDNTKSGSYVDWRHVIQIVEMSEDEESVFTFDTIERKLAFKNIPNVKLNEWYGQSQNDYRGLMSAAVDVPRWEGHPALMGDLTPLVVAREDYSIDVEKTKRRWENLNALSVCIGGNTEDGAFNPDVANWYRLYRVLVGIIPVGHQVQTPWNLVGCHYSKCYDCLESNFAFLKTQSYSEILDSANLLHELQVKCVEILKSENLLSLSDSMDAVHLLKAFLAAKTICNAGTAIEFYDQYAISVDTSISGNKINSAMPLAWGNLICRYGYKLGWKKTGHTGSAFLDTILADGSGVDDTTSFSPEKVNETTQIVESQIKSVLNML